MGRYALALWLSLLSTSCADAERYGPPPGQGEGGSANCVGADCFSPPIDCAEPGPGCPCAAAGEHLVCGHVESQVGSQTVCGKGYSVCSGGVWAPCVINNTAPLVRPAPASSGGSRPLSHGKPMKCVGNPCDPSCWDFIDTPIGEGNENAGLFADAAGVTLVAGGAPSGLYAAADFVRDYDAVGLCAPGSTPLWGLWSWKAPTPADASITFSVQTAESAAELSKAPVDALLFSDPPGPSSLAGKPASARLGPPDTTAGSAVVDTTLGSRGRTRGLPFLRIIAHLAPSSDGKSAPVLAAWDLQMSCAASE